MTLAHSYAVTVFLGNRHGIQTPFGDVWWAYCKELDTLGDGKTPGEAVDSCYAGVKMKLVILHRKGAKIPVPKKADIV